MAEEAAQAITTGADPEDVRRLAVMLQNLGQPKTALPLWRRVVRPGRLTADTRHLLRCADRCDEEDLVLDECAALRRNGHMDRECLDLEIAALGRRSPQTAVALLEDLLSHTTDESLRRFLRLRLSHLGLYEERPELVEADPGRLPAVAEVNAQTGRAVVRVLVHAAALAAVDYAYALYRRFPDDFDAHMAVIESFGWLKGGREFVIDALKAVGPGCAVCVLPAGSRKREWWIVEDGPNPSLVRAERPPSDPVVQRMLGKSKGETFAFRDEPLPAEAKVVRIEDKRVFRWRDCLFGMETRFAHQTPIWSINVGRGRGKYDFTEFLRELDRHAAKGDERDRWYRDGPVPLSMFAKKCGKSVLEAAIHVSNDPDLPFRCCAGSSDEMTAAVEAMRDCTRLVLDTSALATLFLTGTSRWLEQVPAECVVTEHTLHECRQIDLLGGPEDKDVIHMGKVGDQYVHQVWKPEHLRPFRERFANFLSEVETHCTVIPGASLGPLPPEHREVLVEACGRDVAESVVAASADASTILWTDDRTVADLGKFSLKVRRTWTQAVFAWMGLEQLVPEDGRDRLAVDLAAAGYFWTQLTPNAVLAAGSEAGWDVENPRFAAALRRFAAPEALKSGLVTLAGGVLKGLWQRGLLSHQVDGVTFRILKMLDSRPNGRRLIEEILRKRLMLFGGDAYNAARAGQTVRVWTEINRKDAIVIPGRLT
jgi:hypothetical protein